MKSVHRLFSLILIALALAVFPADAQRHANAVQHGVGSTLVGSSKCREAGLKTAPGQCEPRYPLLNRTKGRVLL